MMHRMLRAVLVGLLSVSALACKSGGDSPKSQPGVAAGKVVEVTGTVTVRHDDVARPLAIGETVEGEDVVETGADGTVVIELSHNLARWELAANKKMKVRESLAWSQPKKEGSAATVEQTAAAAGRHAERSAAETSVSGAADKGAAPREAESAPAAQAAPAAPAAVEAAPAPPAQSPRAEAPPPPPRAVAPAPDRRERAKSSGAMPDSFDKPSGGGGSLGVRTRGGGGTGVGTATSQVAPTSDGMAAGGSGFPARDLVLKQQTAIKACLTKDAQAVTVTVTIGADGKATTVVKGKAELPADVEKCVAGVIEKITFPATATTVRVEVRK